MKDDAKRAVVDTLVKFTVRSVLFPELNAKSSPSRPSVARDAGLATKEPSQLTPTDPEIGKDWFKRADHHVHVMSYASWSDTQLEDEKRRLRRSLSIWREQDSVARQSEPEEDDDETDNVHKATANTQQQTTQKEEEAAMLEAYALLTLFQRERDSPDFDQPLAAASGPRTSLLHAQLDLYAKYFELTQRRQIQQEVDILPIRKMYQLFLQSGQRSSSTVA